MNNSSDEASWPPPIDTINEMAPEWIAEAAADPPLSDEWLKLCVDLRFASELDRRGHQNPDLPSGMTSAGLALRAVIRFLQKRHHLNHHGAVAPLLRLSSALGEVADC